MAENETQETAGGNDGAAVDHGAEVLRLADATLERVEEALGSTTSLDMLRDWMGMADAAMDDPDIEARARVGAYHAVGLLDAIGVAPVALLKAVSDGLARYVHETEPETDGRED